MSLQHRPQVVDRLRGSGHCLLYGRCSHLHYLHIYTIACRLNDAGRRRLMGRMGRPQLQQLAHSCLLSLPPSHHALSLSLCRGLLELLCYAPTPTAWPHYPRRINRPAQFREDASHANVVGN